MHGRQPIKMLVGCKTGVRAANEILARIRVILDGVWWLVLRPSNSREENFILLDSKFSRTNIREK